jgi:hypothetical protein
MKTTMTRFLLSTLAVLMLLTVASCRKQPADSSGDSTDSGYILDSSNTEAPENEITSFYKGNTAAVEALAKHMMKTPSYLAYNFSNRMTDYDKGTMEFYVQKQAKNSGAWAECKDESAMRLVNVKFTGTVTYNPAYSKDAVVFTPRMAVADKTLSLVYCANDSGKAAVEAGKYHVGYTVTLTKIEGNWYCAEAVKADQ